MSFQFGMFFTSSCDVFLFGVQILGVATNASADSFWKSKRIPPFRVRRPVVHRSCA